MKNNNTKNQLGDFYWAYADILRGIGINESMYDQRIMAFMAVKLLADNNLVVFNFDYKNSFGLQEKIFNKYKGKDTKETFTNIIKDIKSLGSDKLKYFIQNKQYNPNNEDENILYYINHKRTFPLLDYIDELPNNYLEMVLDIYTQKANFKGYPKEQYKDLYEKTISRMKKLSGDLTGQHFTQKSIIHLMCEYAFEDLKKSKNNILAIYDPACGTGSMLMESAYYFNNKINYTVSGNKRKKQKDIVVYGQEIHGQTWLLCKIFLEISQIQNTIAHGNTLTNPAFDKINGDNSFDFIIANPPFGVDWKHDYDKVIANMQKEDKSNFYVVKDNKNKIVTPKKSDGQFLFMLHIIKLLQVSKTNGKSAKAVVVSSSTLISTGRATSSEAKIRKKIFETKMLQAVVEQPKAMFTNTDITSHLWFFDVKKHSKIRIVKIDNDEQNLFINHPNPNGKMKNSYSYNNIKEIIKLISFQKEIQYISKDIDFANRYEINIANDIDKKNTSQKISLKELSEKFEVYLDNICNELKTSIW